MFVAVVAGPLAVIGLITCDPEFRICVPYCTPWPQEVVRIEAIAQLESCGL